LAAEDGGSGFQHDGQMVVLNDDALDAALFEVFRALFLIHDAIARLQHTLKRRSVRGVLGCTNRCIAHLTDTPVRTQEGPTGRASWGAGSSGMRQ
jgi:hypothetical protein